MLASQPACRFADQPPTASLPGSLPAAQPASQSASQPTSQPKGLCRFPKVLTKALAKAIAKAKVRANATASSTVKVRGMGAWGSVAAWPRRGPRPDPGALPRAALGMAQGIAKNRAGARPHSPPPIRRMQTTERNPTNLQPIMTSVSFM